MTPTHRPNIIIFVTDHLTQRAVGAYGQGAQAPTPHMDAIAARGVRFADAYTVCPICVPSRAALWTGRLPHETGVHTNAKLSIPAGMDGLGSLAARAGYRGVHVGKTHDSEALRGMEMVDGRWDPAPDAPPWKAYGDTQQDCGTTAQALAFLAGAQPDPYLLVVDYNNPHDICLWVGDHIGPHVDEPVPGPLPPLPANFETADMASRPIAVRRNCCSNFRVAQSREWTPENFRHYLAAYYHYTERVDRDIGEVMAALARRDDAENTLVLLIADHGDGMASHRMVTKGGHFYEETTRVPFVLAGPGIPGGGRELRGPLVSLLDVVPTMCAVMGVAAPEGLTGRSLLPLVRGEAPTPEPEYVVSTWRGGGAVLSPARMIRTRKFKYNHFLEDGGEELYDLAQDPGETRNLVTDPAFGAVLETHRALLREHCRRTGDPYFSDQPHIAPDRRTHGEGACPFIAG